MSTAVAAPPSGGIAKKPEKGIPYLKSCLQGEQFREALRQSLPKHLPPDRFLRVALTCLTKTPKLGDCDPASFFAAMLTLTQLGIEPDGRRAHLIPYGKTVQLILDYKGIAELVMRSGIVSTLHADVVCENDEFQADKGQIVFHRVDYRKPRGEVYAVYAICRFKDGAEKTDVMTRDEVESVRARSRAGKAGPWVTDWNEMAKKTVFRRLSKWLPLSPDVQQAIESGDDGIIPAETVAAPRRISDSPLNEVFSLPAAVDDAQVDPARGEESQVTPDAEPTNQVPDKTDTVSEAEDENALNGLGDCLAECETVAAARDVKARFTTPTLSAAQQQWLTDATNRRISEIGAKK